MTKYGFSDESWEKAKKEACTVLADVARRKDTIAYSELVAKIGAIHLEPHDYAVREFLGEISTEEHDKGRGMLSAVVTYRQEKGTGYLSRGFDGRPRLLKVDSSPRAVAIAARQSSAP
jgi:hypothetical protein